MKLVFLKLILNLFACIQAAILVNSLTDFSSSRTLPFDKVKVVSSANHNILNLVMEGRLFVYSKKRIGPSVEPWGTPQVTYPVFDLISLAYTNCCPFERQLSKNLLVLLLNPRWLSFPSNIWWATVSKAFLRFRNIAHVNSFLEFCSRI